MSREDAGTLWVKEPEWEDNSPQALQMEHGLKVERESETATRARLYTEREMKQERTWESDWATQDGHAECEPKDAGYIDYETNKETVEYISKSVKEELEVGPEEFYRPKHVVQSHEPKPQDDYNKQAMITSSRNKTSLINLSIPVRETLHKCDHCSYATDSEESLQQHVKIHCVCVYCKYTAASEVSLLLHVSTHASEKPKTYAKRSYASAKQGGQGMRASLYTKHGVKEEPVSTQAGHMEHEVKKVWEWASNEVAQSGLCTDHTENPEDVLRPKQLLARQKEKLQSQAGRQANHMVYEANGMSEAARQAGLYIKHEADNEPESEEGVQAAHVMQVSERETGTKAALIYEVKEEPANEVGTQACIEHVVKEECISENPAQLEPASKEGIQAGHVKQVSERGTDTKAALVYEVKEEPANGEGTQACLEHVVKEECMSEKAAQAEPESEVGVQAGHITRVSERGTGTKAALIYEVKEEPANEVGTQVDRMELEVKEECISEKAAQAEPESEEGVQAGHVTQVSERGTGTKAAFVYEVKEEPANEAGTPACLEHVVKEECMSEKAAQAEPEREEGGQAGPVTRVCGAAEREVQQEAGGGVCAREGEGAARAALTALYAGHEVKEELVLGPEEVHTPQHLLASEEPAKQEDQNEQPMTKPVMKKKSRILNSKPVAEKSNKHNYSDDTRPLKNNDESHNGPVKYKCVFCSYTCSDKINLQNHQRSHIGREYQCDLCDYSSSCETRFTLHEKIHSIEKPYKCAHCCYASVRKSYLESHVKIHTGGKTYKCSYCSFVCADRHQFRAHKIIHTGEKPYKCTHCSDAFANRYHLIKHKITHTGVTLHKCVHCDFACVNKSFLKAHEMKHTGEKPYKCAHCNYATTRKIYLKDHIRTHTGEKPYKCNNCSFASAQRATLQAHLSTHTGEKYKCALCNYVTVCKNYLRIHERTHAAEKAYQCAHCSFGTAYRHSIIVHLKTHGEKPYKCTCCGYVCAQKLQLRIHETQLHSDKKSYKCAYCDFASFNKRNLQYHRKKHIGDIYNAMIRK